MCRGMLALAVTLVVGCKAPIQYGGPIPIDNGGLGGRLASLCRAGMGGRAQSGCFDEVSDARDAGGDEVH